jgi:plastocyanin
MVTIQVSNFTIVDKQGQANVAGEGHVHFYLDAGTVPQTPGKPAIPDENVRWAHVSGTSYTFTNVTGGMHSITVQLVNNDHTPLIPLVFQVITVNVAGSMTPPATTMPPMTTMPPGTTTPAVTTMPPTIPTPSGGGNTVQVTLTAQNIAFDKSTITVPAGSTVVMVFNNMDSGVPHNFALYTDLHATSRIFVGDFNTGPKTVTYTFTAPATPGNYFFRCDVHPETMTGTFTVT